MKEKVPSSLQTAASFLDGFL